MSEIEAASYPPIRYIIAITPRSGSSFLCDIVKKTNILGMPGEFLSNNSMVQLQGSIPADTLDQYLYNILKVYQTDNAVAGVKATWFQFRKFYTTLQNPAFLHNFKYIYLTRFDLALQAVSLYKATETTVFDTATDYPETAVQKLESLDYNFEKIDYWYRHILEHEQGWQQFFAVNGISPLVIDYNDICHNWQAVVKKIVLFMEMPDFTEEIIETIIPGLDSAFKKISDARNSQWAQRFCQEKMNDGELIRSTLLENAVINYQK
jgi:LPS sulfotransferase NodH